MELEALEPHPGDSRRPYLKHSPAWGKKGVVPTLTPGERRMIITPLSPLLVQHPGTRIHRLRRWISSGFHAEC